MPLTIIVFSHKCLSSSVVKIGLSLLMSLFVKFTAGCFNTTIFNNEALTIIKQGLVFLLLLLSLWAKKHIADAIIKRLAFLISQEELTFVKTLKFHYWDWPVSCKENTSDLSITFRILICFYDFALYLLLPPLREATHYSLKVIQMVAITLKRHCQLLNLCF